MRTPLGAWLGEAGDSGRAGAEQHDYCLFDTLTTVQRPEMLYDTAVSIASRDVLDVTGRRLQRLVRQFISALVRQFQ